MLGLPNVLPNQSLNILQKFLFPYDKTSFVKEGTAFKVCGDKNVYRLYSHEAQKHFYTESKSERDKLVRETSFVYEGVAFKVN